MTPPRETNTELAQARQVLAEIYTPDGIEVWLHGRKRSLNSERPLDLIARGDGERVLARIRQLLDGSAT